MNPDIQKQVMDALEALAKALGTTAQYLWGVLLRQAYVQAAQEDVAAMVAIAGVIVLFRVLAYSKKRREEDEYYDWDQIDFGFSIAGIIVLSLTAIVLLIVSLGLWLNPAYYALQQIAEMIRR